MRHISQIILAVLLAFTLLASSTQAVPSIQKRDVTHVANFTLVKGNHLAERGIKEWIDRKIIDPIVDKTKPVMHKEVLDMVQRTKPTLLDDFPAIFRDTLAEIIGVKPIASPDIKCGWLQPLCNAIIKPLDNIIQNAKKAMAHEVDLVLDDSVAHCEAAAIKGVKRQLYLSAESRRRLDERGLKNWYHGKINTFVQNVMKEVRPELHVVVLEVKQKWFSKLPSSVVDAINVFLPNSLKIKVPQHFESDTTPTGNDTEDAALVARGIFDPIKRKITEWATKIINSIKASLEKKTNELEDKMMDIIIKTSAVRAAELLPFFKEGDADFKPRSD